MIMKVDLIADINLGLWFGKGELMLYFDLAIDIYLGGWDGSEREEICGGEGIRELQNALFFY